MIHNDPRTRRAARHLALLATVIASVGLFRAVADALPAGTAPAGSMALNPATGNSGTTFSLVFSNPPQVCPGDAIAGYRWGTFLTPATNDPAPIVYTASGSPQGPAFTGSLRDPAGTQIRAQNPGLSDGLVVAPLQVSFTSAAFASLPPGDYNVGIACTLADAAGLVQTTKFWSTQITITASSGAGPNNFTYGPTQTSATTTTTTTAAATTTTTAAATTTTTTVAGGTTTTTVAGGSTTTSTTLVPGATTTTTLVGAFPATPITPQTPTGGSPSSSFTSSPTLVATGWSNLSIAVWGALLLVFGRMAVLLSRPVRIVQADR